MRAATIAVILLVGAAACEREPAIVIRFDPVDLAGRDLARPRAVDAAAPAVDAASPAAVPATDLRKKRPADAGTKVAAATDACASDADCVVVPEGCCGCANGGKQRAVLKRDQARLIAAQRQGCKDVMCTMMISTDPTCGQRAACAAGACALRAARPDELKKSRLPAPQ